MLPSPIEYKSVKPDPSLLPFVDFFWMLTNDSDKEKEVVVLPDGRFDILFGYSASEPYNVLLTGLGTEPSKSALPPRSVMFAISFKLLAVEYVLDTTISGFLNNVYPLPDDFWGITVDDMSDFTRFFQKASGKITGLLKEVADDRKTQLFDLIYSSNGSLTVKELSGKLYWPGRQINRYFSSRFGISLKAYCTILRFRASFPHIKEGKLFPEQAFADQAHFIKEVKKFAGVAPKELSRNKDDRFIHFSTLPAK